MPKFALVEGDVTTLTQAFNALRAGMGTYLAPTATLEGFLEAWKGSSSAFASEAGFIALGMENHPKGAATVVLCQFAEGAVDALLGEQFRKLCRELLKGFDLQVIRAATATVEGDRLALLAGFLRDGVLRKLVADADGMLSDLSMYSLTVDDLAEVAPANFVYADHNGEAVQVSETQEALPLGA